LQLLKFPIQVIHPLQFFADDIELSGMGRAERLHHHRHHLLLMLEHLRLHGLEVRHQGRGIDLSTFGGGGGDRESLSRTNGPQASPGNQSSRSPSGIGPPRGDRSGLFSGGRIHPFRIRGQGRLIIFSNGIGGTDGQQEFPQP
jgi:hypothetical protein